MGKKSWTKEELELLRDNYRKTTLNEVCELFPTRSKDSVRNKIKKIKRNSFEINKNCLAYIFNKYKNILKGDVSRGLTHDKLYLTYLFKYHLRKNNISTDREYILKNYIIGNLLYDAKLKTSVKKSFNCYFDFISLCFPKYKFYEWEFKI